MIDFILKLLHRFFTLVGYVVFTVTAFAFVSVFFVIVLAIFLLVSPFYVLFKDKRHGSF